MAQGDKDIAKIAVIMEQLGSGMPDARTGLQPQFHTIEQAASEDPEHNAPEQVEDAHEDTMEWDLDPETIWIRDEHAKSAALYDNLSGEEREEHYQGLGLKIGIKSGGSSFLPHTSEILSVWEAPAGIKNARAAEVAFKKMSDPNVTVFNIVRDPTTEVWLVNYYERADEE